MTLVTGYLCAFSSGYSNGGTYISSHIPVEEYSTEYVAPYLLQPSFTGYDIHVLAVNDGTRVTALDNDYIVNSGEALYLHFGGRGEITKIQCSLPCNVVQYTIGLSGNTAMFMTTVLPTEKFGTEAYFTTTQNSYDFHISVVVDSPTPVDDLFLDGQPFTPQFWYESGNYTYTAVDISGGSHAMTSSGSRFALYTYSHFGVESGGYGYLALPERSRYQAKFLTQFTSSDYCLYT